MASSLMPGRTAEFHTGINGSGNVASLMNSSNKFMNQVPNRFVANGLNQQFMPSANGMSPGDSTRQTPSGMVPSRNGMSNDTYSKLYPSFGSLRPI